MKVLLAADGSDHTKRMLAFVAAHDELFGPATEFTVLTVVTPIPARLAAFMSASSIEAYYREAAEEVFGPIRRFAVQARWNVRFHHSVGGAAEGIAEAAREGRHDLVVVGSHGHGAVTGLMLGSVSTGVLARCDAPVLIVR